MSRNPLEPVIGVVSSHNVLVVLVMLALTGGVAAGISGLDLSNQTSGEDAVGDTEVAQKHEYILEHYQNETGNGTGADANVTPAVVYVRDPGGNVLSKEALLGSLRYQKRALENDSVAAALAERDGVVGVANLVARRAAGRPDADLDAQIAALEAASESEVRDLVSATLAEGSPALRLLPSDYEPGTPTASSRRMLFNLRGGPEGSEAAATRTRATRVLFEAAADRESPEYFTIGEHAIAKAGQVANRNILELVLPVSLLVILAVLAFSYRDLVDVVVGFAGVVVSVVWMFGILGWLGVSAGMTAIVGPVLIVGLSVDYGLHVFMRYREQRGPEEGIREPMTRSLSAVAVALALVTTTTAVGFLANLANEFTSIRNLAVGITLGVVSAFVVFVTLVPALKVTVDRLLGRVGFERRKRPLGKTGLLRPFLAGGVGLARRVAPVVIVVALVAGAAGAIAWTDLDRQAFQQQTDDVAEWKKNLPEPLAWEVPEARTHQEFVQTHYRNADESRQRTSQILVEGDVTAPGTLERVHGAARELETSDLVYQQGEHASIVSPVSVMQSVAAEDEEFAATLQAADADGDGVPDRNLAGVYDALYEAAPDRAAAVVERTDGEYRSLRMVVPIRRSAVYAEQADVMQAGADAVEAGSDDLSATAVGSGTFVEAELGQTTRSILATLLVALAAVGAILVVIYRLVEGSATLGAVTVLPIALVTALVVGGMWILDVPLTLVTALLMSLVIGLGIDYNIHVSHRFAQELGAGRDVFGALTEAVTGTGGALLGSTLTSTGAFSALLLHPHPQLQSFGTLVVLALTLSFAVSVFVLPSLLAIWARYAAPTAAGVDRVAAPGD